MYVREVVLKLLTIKFEIGLLFPFCHYVVNVDYCDQWSL